MKAASVFLVLGVLALAALAAVQFQLERSVAAALRDLPSDDWSQGPPKWPTPGERALTAGARVGATREQIEGILLKMADAGLSAPAGNAGSDTRVLSALALSALSQIASAPRIAHLTKLARTLPESVRDSAMACVVAVASRTDVEQLPGVVRELVKNEDTNTVFKTLDGLAAKAAASQNQADQRRLAVIRSVLEEAVTNPKVVQGHVDSILDRHYPDYRNSALRIRVLNQLKTGPYEAERKYAAAQLALLPSPLTNDAPKVTNAKSPTK